MKRGTIVLVVIVFVIGVALLFLIYNKQDPLEASKKLRNVHRDYEFEICILAKVRSLLDITTCSYIEWVEFHISLGVDHIFISNECSPEQHFSPILDYYASFGILTDTSAKRNCDDYAPDEDESMRTNFRLAKERCRWITAIDMDEYINIIPNNEHTHQGGTGKHEDISTNLKEVLINSEYPFIRMPWWVIGSDDREQRPVGLTIDSYRHGALALYLIKSLTKGSEIESWSFQHHPWLSAADSGKLLFGNTTRGAYVTNLKLFEDEYETISRPAPHGAHNSSSNLTISVNYPTNRIFLKHYLYLSYEEYSLVRAVYNKTAGNAPNIWNENPRDRWLGGGSVKYRHFIHSFNEEFTSIMSKKVKLALRKREAHAASSKDSSSLAVFQMCAKYWGLKRKKQDYIG